MPSQRESVGKSTSASMPPRNTSARVAPAAVAGGAAASVHALAIARGLELLSFSADPHRSPDTRAAGVGAVIPP
jgi:hypothetical protein